MTRLVHDGDILFQTGDIFRHEWSVRRGHLRNIQSDLVEFKAQACNLMTRFLCPRFCKIVRYATINLAWLGII